MSGLLVFPQTEQEGFVRLDHDYGIEVAPGTHLGLCLGYTTDMPAGMTFGHVNLISSAPASFDFRRPDRSWYKRTGVEHWFAIPRRVVGIVPEKGWSYVPLAINGVELVLNVSASSNPQGQWVDHVTGFDAGPVNLPLASLLRIAAVAERTPATEALLLEHLESVGRQRAALASGRQL